MWAASSRAIRPSILIIGLLALACATPTTSVDVDHIRVDVAVFDSAYEAMAPVLFSVESSTLIVRGRFTVASGRVQVEAAFTGGAEEGYRLDVTGTQIIDGVTNLPRQWPYAFDHEVTIRNLPSGLYPLTLSEFLVAPGGGEALLTTRRNLEPRVP